MPDSAQQPPIDSAPPGAPAEAPAALRTEVMPAATPPVGDAGVAEPAHVDTAKPAAPVRAELSPAECAARLAELFPALFAAIPHTPPKPIKLRIQTDIQQRAPELFTRRALSHFLHRHTTTTAYLRALVASPHRYDLDGAPAGEVNDEHRQAAQVELDRRRAIVETRRAAERAARQAPRRAPQGPPGRCDGEIAGEGADAPADGARREAAPHDARPPRPARPARPPRPQRPREDRGDSPGARADRPPPAPQRPRAHAHVPTQTTPRTPDPVDLLPVAVPVPPPPGPDDVARRERALLLRAFEASPLSRANFCALKRIDPAELDAVLEQARREAPPAPAPRASGPRPSPPPPPRRSRR